MRNSSMNHLLQKGLSWFNRSRPQPSQVAEFRLFLGVLEVGRLRWDGTRWGFTYTQEFAEQDLYAPITDFPDMNRSYFSEDLWPFFALRIPSRTQEAVKRWLRDQNQTEIDDVSMLQRFGIRTATNPFILQPA